MRPEGESAAPTRSALELGQARLPELRAQPPRSLRTPLELLDRPDLAPISRQENATFRVYVRVRPLLAREKDAGVAECIEVSDTSFPRQPPPQRLVVSDPRLSGRPCVESGVPRAAAARRRACRTRAGRTPRRASCLPASPHAGTELFEHRAKRGDFVFDRAFCPGSQARSDPDPPPPKPSADACA